MGCDIHAYLEVHADEKWRQIAALHTWRDYELFEAMAGVRGSAVNAVIAPRGYPRDADDIWTSGEYTLFIYAGAEVAGSCTPAQAAEWIADGSSDWWDPDHRRITHPDHHTPSWLTADEMSKVAEKVPESQAPMLAAMMQAIERTGPRARLVFWFDN